MRPVHSRTRSSSHSAVTRSATPVAVACGLHWPRGETVPTRSDWNADGSSAQSARRRSTSTRPGTVSVLDQAHRRLLRWHKGAREPVRVPLSISGTIADLAVGNDGSTYVLESTAEPGRNALVRRFDDAGRELEAIETAERTSSQIRMARDGAHVLGHPSHHWMPVTVGGVPASREAQLRRGRAGRRCERAAEVVLFRHANEIRVAMISGAQHHSVVAADERHASSRRCSWRSRSGSASSSSSACTRTTSTSSPC